MSEHHARIEWQRTTESFTYEDYERDHTWRIGANVTIPASAAPGFKGSEGRVDPEEAFVAALSSCHMLTFLASAAKKRLVVDGYEDDAVGVLEKNEDGRMAVTRVTLRPRIRWGGEAPNDATVDRIHDKAHHACFIANSVKTQVTVEEPGSVGAA